MTPEEAFGSVLRQLRNEKKISQEKLSHDGGLDRTFISLLERGLRQPSLSTIFQISIALEIEPDELIRQVNQALKESCAKEIK